MLVKAVWPLLQPPGVTAGRFFCVCWLWLTKKLANGEKGRGEKGRWDRTAGRGTAAAATCAPCTACTPPGARTCGRRRPRAAASP